MIQDPKVSRHNLVFKDSSGWNINPVPMVCNYDDSTLQQRSESLILVHLFVLENFKVH